MSTPLAVSCPHCGAGLKLKNNNFVGKKVPCPKCKQPFLVEQPPEDEFLSQDDDFGAMDDTAEDEEEAEAPRSKGKSRSDSKNAKGKGKKKSKSGGGFAPIAMIAGGVVLGLGLLGGIVYGAIAMLSGEEKATPAVVSDAAVPALAEPAAKPKLGDSLTDITAYPGKVIDAGEKSKDKINALNDQHQADLEAQMQEGGAAHAAPAPAPAQAPAANGSDPASVMHAAPAAAPVAPVANAGGNDPAKVMHAVPAAAPVAPAGNAGAADPAKVMHAAAPAGAAAENGQNAGQAAEKPAVPKSRSRRRTTEK